MRYAFMIVPRMPVSGDVELGIRLPKLAAESAAAEVAATVSLSIVASTSSLVATVGTPIAFSFLLTNVGLTSADGAIVTAAWLADNTDRTFGAMSATPAGGVVLDTFTKAAVQAGAVVTTWPPGDSITLTLSVSALVAFFEALATTVTPQLGTSELFPVDNTAVIALRGMMASYAVVWQDFDTPSNQATTIVAGVQDPNNGSIRFCGDGFSRRKTGFASFVAADACPPSNNAAGAAWQIKILSYNAANTYTVTQNYSALTPQPATYADTFVVTQSGDILTVTTAYTLLGDTVADSIACAGNALFDVKENGVSIGVLTLTLVQY